MIWILMNAYFNQDYDLSGESDEAILINFADGHNLSDIQATIAELDQMVGLPIEGLLERFLTATGECNMIIGENDPEAHVWLTEARNVLANYRCP